MLRKTGKLVILGILFAGYPAAVPRVLTAAEPAAGTEASRAVVIPSGTRVLVQVRENISTAGHSDERRYDVYVVNEVRTDGTIVIPGGTLMHAALTKCRETPDHGLSFYSMRLTDLELRGVTYPVDTDSFDITVDPVTGSPYIDRVTNTLIPADTVISFTLGSPLTVKDGGAGTR